MFPWENVRAVVDIARRLHEQSTVDVLENVASPKIVHWNG
tara:strand:+ start:185 stop:304 length:120 start_codon:yes stop_codon:yes gene_type:complete